MSQFHFFKITYLSLVLTIAFPPASLASDKGFHVELGRSILDKKIETFLVDHKFDVQWDRLSPTQISIILGPAASEKNSPIYELQLRDLVNVIAWKAFSNFGIMEQKRIKMELNNALSSMGLSLNMSEKEIKLYERYPDHPLFHRLLDLAIRPRHLQGFTFYNGVFTVLEFLKEKRTIVKTGYIHLVQVGEVSLRETDNAVTAHLRRLLPEVQCGEILKGSFKVGR